MSWLHDLVRPRFRASLQPASATDPGLWVRCGGCRKLQYRPDLEQSFMVCECGHHGAISPQNRIAMLLDEGVCEPVVVPKSPVDPLKFRDRRRYSERLRDARERTGSDDAITIVKGSIGGNPVILAVMDFEFLGGSMGVHVGEAIISGAGSALANSCPFVVVTASGGARMQEGILSLMQMPRTTISLSRLGEAGLPYITILTHPTTGGVSASFAMLGDVTFAEPGAVIGFAGQRVIEETVREQLPEGFQCAEYLLEHGMIDAIVARAELKSRLANILDLLMRRHRKMARLAPAATHDSKEETAAPSSSQPSEPPVRSS